MASDLKEEKWREDDYRRQHVDHIIEVLADWTKTHTTAELFELGQLMHFPWAPVSSPKDVFNSPQLRARNFFTMIDHPEANNSFAYPAPPGKFNGLSWNIRGRAPLVGEHNAQIYHEELGFLPEELAKLSSGNVI
jgi:crotonobetainyl-CoA:carnitine CoA-transferase CaiB-like acyl-CoA transferase